MTTIYLIRHGQASFGQQNYDLLSEKGELQAQILGQSLKNMIKAPPYVVAGSMHRHQQTAQLALAECFPEVKIETNADWNEFDHQQIIAKYDPRFEQAESIKQALALAHDPKAYLIEIFHAAISRWMSGEHDHDYTESWSMFKLRVDSALQQLCKNLNEQKPRQTLVFSSGGVISHVISQLLELNLDKSIQMNWAITNASYSTLAFSNQKMMLMGLNENYFLKAVDATLETWV